MKNKNTKIAGLMAIILASGNAIHSNEANDNHEINTFQNQAGTSISCHEFPSLAYMGEDFFEGNKIEKISSPRICYNLDSPNSIPTIAFNLETLGSQNLAGLYFEDGNPLPKINYSKNIPEEKKYEFLQYGINAIQTISQKYPQFNLEKNYLNKLDLDFL